MSSAPTTTAAPTPGLFVTSHGSLRPESSSRSMFHFPHISSGARLFHKTNPINETAHVNPNRQYLWCQLIDSSSDDYGCPNARLFDSSRGSLRAEQTSGNIFYIPHILSVARLFHKTNPISITAHGMPKYFHKTNPINETNPNRPVVSIDCPQLRRIRLPQRQVV